MNLEDQIIEVRRKQLLESEKFDKQLKLLRKKLKKCTHKHTSSYWWEANNGYASAHSGLECRACGQIKYWESSDNWSDPA